MRILYLALKYDYGQPERGYSFEHYNFYDSLRHMGVDLLYFDFMSLLRKYGKAGMNRRLWEVVKAEQPDLLFSVLFQDELDPRVLRKITVETATVTVNWFCDDHWRFENFSRHWAPCFNWVVTTDADALPKYARMGYAHALKSQWACNHHLYHPYQLSPAYEVTFVGQPHGNRRQIVEEIAAAEIPIIVWGRGWDAGRITQAEMIRLFNQSRINLNLSNVSTGMLTPGKRLASALRRRGARLLDRLPGGKQAHDWLRHTPLPQLVDSLTVPAPFREQIKGRNFEVPGCGGFLLTNWVEGLEEYYDIGREIVCFSDTSELIARLHYYLQHEDERLAIAGAGYERTQREHTYTRRFEAIGKQIGLPFPPAPSGETGHTEEVE